MSRLFDGVNDEINVGDVAPIDITGTAFSCYAWIYLRTVPAATTLPAVLGKGHLNDANGIQYAMIVDDASNVIGRIGSATGFDQITVGAISIDTWTHMGLTYDGVNLLSYKNAILQNTVAATRSIQNRAEPLGFGARYTTLFDQFLNAKIAEIAIHNVTLSITEIHDAMRQGRTYRGLKGYWPLWGISSPEVDLSGQASHGTVNGAILNEHAPIGRYAPAPKYKMPHGAVIATALNAESISSGKNVLRWTDASSGFTVTVQRSIDDVTFSDLASLLASVAKYTDTTPVSKTRYFYRISW